MAFLFRGIFQPLRPPSPSEMPEASGWQLLTGFQIVLLFPNLDWSRMRLLSTCLAEMREIHLSFLPDQMLQRRLRCSGNSQARRTTFCRVCYSASQDEGCVYQNQTAAHRYIIHSAGGCRDNINGADMWQLRPHGSQFGNYPGSWAVKMSEWNSKRQLLQPVSNITPGLITVHCDSDLHGLLTCVYAAYVQ